ncbi:MAG: hypothetical protein ABXS91_10680 [Sulfurimonas sp.]
MKKIVLSMVLAGFGLTSAAFAEENQTKSQYSYKYQKQQKEQAKNQYKKQNRYKNEYSYQGINPNRGSMHTPAMRMGGGRNR